jgi:hypothetical protein
MAAPVVPASPADLPSDGPRASISAKTLRKDRWWLQPTISGGVLLSFIIYSTWAAFQNADYYAKPYISPFYSPCIASVCDSARNVATSAGRITQARSGIVATGSDFAVHVPNVGIFGPWWIISPAILILIFPLGFRLTCYYYRRAYYRAFWQSPPACAVAEPHKHYTGETRFPLILQNAHRYFFYFGVLFNILLTYDAVQGFRNANGAWGHMGFGTLVLIVNAGLLWLYTLSCHSCRHIIGGRLKHFSRHPIRFKFWGVVTKLNSRHMQLAWASLIFVGLTDFYIRLVASGTISDPRFF